MMKTHRLSRITGAVVLALGLSTSAMADDTSSSIRGNVLTEAGNPVTDATITILHVPSGTRKTLKVNDSGAFSAKGLRVGGPYTVTIDSNVYADKTLENIYISLGDIFRVSETLQEASIERIAVTGSSSFYDPSKGSSSVFSGDALSKSASFSRDLKDIVKQNPLAVVGNDGNSLYLAGSNPRYNSLKVDGVNLNDDFGLAGNGYPTERSPIAFDSVDQISVAIAPFSAKEGGFSGGQISVVTKSGTNEFHGSTFFEKSKDAWAGTPRDPGFPSLVDASDPNDRNLPKDLDLIIDEEAYGFTLGGPIIKDKLFFFASYETFESVSPITTGPQDSNVATKADDVFQADVDRVTGIAQDTYGYDAGDWNKSIPLEDEKYSLKLDWNITDDQRASFAYSHGFSNSAGNNFGGTRRLYLSSHWYNRSNEFDTYVGQLFSNWNENFSTEIKVSYKESQNGQISLGGNGFGEVWIDNVDGDGDGSGRGEIRLGSDDSRHANELSNETLQVNLSGEYLYEDHAISFGWEYEKVDVVNLFMQHNLGSWYFNSIDDFEARIADRFEYQNNKSLDRNDAAASFSLENHALFVEDSWDVNDEFNLVYGLRYEVIQNGDSPTFNSGFYDRNGITNTENLDGKDIILPRVGFTWDATDDLVITGGFGRFSGGRPNVFISNAFSNDGFRISSFDSGRGQAIAGADPSGIPQNALDAVASSEQGGPNSNIDAIDPDFKIASTWQYSIAADYRADFSAVGLGEDWRVSAELLYKDIERDLIWKDLSRELDTAKGNNGLTVDGRPIYRRTIADRSERDILLTNASGGHSTIATISLAKQWENGLSVNFSYANSSINDRLSATGTSTNTAYEFNPVIDPNNPEIGTSSFETKHRLTFNLSYNTEFYEGYNTGLHMFFERKSARPYSWVLQKSFRSDDQLNGDSSLDNFFLPYLPTGASDTAVDFENGLSYDEIQAVLQGVGVSGKGGYLGKNSSRGPWTTTMDLRLEQEIPGFMEGHKGIFYIDIKNALAIFDQSSARVYRNDFGTSTADLFNYSINDAGQYVLGDAGVDASDVPVSFQDRASTWVAKVGVKYTF